MQRNPYEPLQAQIPVVIPVEGDRDKKWITGRSHAGQPHSGLPTLVRMVGRKEVGNIAKQAAGYDFLVLFNAYARAQRDGDELASQTFLRKLIELHNRPGKLDESTFTFVFGVALSKQEVGATWVTGVSARLLEGCTLAFWVRDGSREMEPVMYCPRLEQAVAIHMLFGEHVPRVCRSCGSVFTAKSNQDCCSDRCRERHRVRRFRFRQKINKEKA